MTAGAPTPPDPDSERLVMPDNNLYRPITGQATDGTFYNYPAQDKPAGAALSDSQFRRVYPGQVSQPGFHDPSAAGQQSRNRESSGIVKLTCIGRHFHRDLHHLHQLDSGERRRLQRLSLSERLPGRHEFSKPDCAGRILSQELQSRLSKTVHLQVQ